MHDNRVLVAGGSLQCLFQPVTERGMGSGVEVDYPFGLLFIIIASYHVIVQITFYFLQLGIGHCEVA